MGKARRLKRQAAQSAKPTRASGVSLAEVAATPRSPELSGIITSPTREVGVSGTNNWTGRIHAEANSRLQWNAAYGTPGATDWGAWETLHRTDHAVAGSLNMLAAPLRDATVSVDFPECADELDEATLEAREAIASFVRDNLTKWLEPLWPQLVEQIVTYGLGYGFALHERVMGTRPDARVPGGTAVYLRKLAQRLPSSVKTDGWMEKDGELSVIKQAGLKDGRWTETIELPAASVLLSTWNRSGNNYQGFSAFRPIWYLSTIRAALLKILAIGHEREALGTPVATMGADVQLSTTQRTELQSTLENIRYHENQGLSLPPGVDIEWFFSPGANKGNVLETWRALGLAIYELVQVQQIALGTQDTGSRAVGEVHDASKNAFIAGIRAWVESVFNGIGGQPYTGIVRQLVDLNFGPQEEYPVLRLVTDATPIGTVELATAIKTLTDAKALVLGDADEDYLRERLGLPAVDPDERAAREAEAEAAPVEGDPAVLEPETEDEDDAEPVDDGAPENTGEVVPLEPVAFGEGQPFQPWRALRPTELRLNLSEMDAFHNSARADFEAMVRPIVEEMVLGSKAQVAEAMADADPSELKTLKLDRKLLKKAVEVFVERCRAFGYRQARLEVRTSYSEGYVVPNVGPESIEGLRVFLKDPPKDDAPLVDVTPDSLRGAVEVAEESLVAAQAEMVAERITTRTRHAIWDSAIDAVRQGRNADAAIDRVLEQLSEGKQLRTDAGLVTTRSISIGREQLFRQADVAKLELSAILDSNTCAACRSVDGEIVEVGSARHQALLPPLEECAGKQNCRCLMLPLLH